MHEGGFGITVEVATIPLTNNALVCIMAKVGVTVACL